jgi:hypothetical protein
MNGHVIGKGWRGEKEDHVKYGTGSNLVLGALSPGMKRPGSEAVCAIHVHHSLLEVYEHFSILGALVALRSV